MIACRLLWTAINDIGSSKVSPLTWVVTTIQIQRLCLNQYKWQSVLLGHRLPFFLLGCVRVDVSGGFATLTWLWILACYLWFSFQFSLSHVTVLHYTLKMCFHNYLLCFRFPLLITSRQIIIWQFASRRHLLDHRNFSSASFKHRCQFRKGLRSTLANLNKMRIALEKLLTYLTSWGLINFYTNIPILNTLFWSKCYWFTYRDVFLRLVF